MSRRTIIAKESVEEQVRILNFVTGDKYILIWTTRGISNLYLSIDGTDDKFIKNFTTKTEAFHWINAFTDGWLQSYQHYERLLHTTKGFLGKVKRTLYQGFYVDNMARQITYAIGILNSLIQFIEKGDSNGQERNKVIKPHLRRLRPKTEDNGD